jgi:hypothetical protein
MNDQQILEFIATKQPVRAVQLADKFDVDLKSASDALKSLVDVGDLTRTSGTAPNQQPAQFYSLSETFLKSKEGKLVIARIESQQSAVPQPPAVTLPLRVPPPTPIEATIPSPVPAPTAAAATPEPSAAPPSPADDASLRRIERAIAHIREHGPTSDADIRAVLNLRADQYPSNFIGRAVKDGRLAKDGREWTLGPGTPPAPVVRRPAFGGPLGLRGATPFPVGAHDVPNDAWKRDNLTEEVRPHPPAADLADPAVTQEILVHLKQMKADLPSPVFRCGLWSDGVLELQRNGVTVAELQQDEGETVAAFMARLQQPLASTG